MDFLSMNKVALILNLHKECNIPLIFAYGNDIHLNFYKCYRIKTASCRSFFKMFFSLFVAVIWSCLSMRSYYLCHGVWVLSGDNFMLWWCLHLYSLSHQSCCCVGVLWYCINDTVLMILYQWCWCCAFMLHVTVIIDVIIM